MLTGQREQSGRAHPWPGEAILTVNLARGHSRNSDLQAFPLAFARSGLVTAGVA